MMPLFFHIEAHLWIIYLFLFNGLLTSTLISCGSMQFRKLTNSMEAKLLSGFFISLLVNGAILFALDKLGVEFINAKYIFSIFTGLLLISLFLLREHCQKTFQFETNWLRVLLYLLTFIVLFYNGGLIELVSDSWWHMSLANKIGYENSFTLSRGHLNGVASRYYPPLWHSNLALLNILSDSSIPVIWNAFTAWGAMFKVMGFYLLALGLSKDKSIALLSAALFFILPGLGDSYMRVSAWPSHISYTAWFCLFYVGFVLLDAKVVTHTNVLIQIFQLLKSQMSIVISFGFLCALIFLSHQAEFLWYLMGMVFYGCGLVIYKQLSRSSLTDIQENTNVISLMLISCLTALSFYSVYCFYPLLTKQAMNDDQLLSGLILLLSLLLILAFALGQLLNHNILSRGSSIILSIFIGVVLLLSIDSQQFISLFIPSYALPMSGVHERPLIALGILNGELRLPGWHLQLRSGLLYSGILGVFLSILLVVVKVNRMTLFLLVNSVIPFLFFISPYLYEWLNVMLNYHSWWRIGMLIFHPIIFAVVIRGLFLEVKK